MKSIPKLLLSLLCVGVASHKPIPGAIPNVQLAGGTGIHMDAMSTMGVEGMKA